MRKFARRIAGPLSALIGAVLLVGAAAGPVGADGHDADDGLELAGATTYRLDVGGAEVDVEIRFTARNTVPDRRQGSQILQTFFTGIQEAIATEAINIVATQNGVSIAIEPVETLDIGYVLYDITFRRNLFYNQTAEVVVEYSLPSGLPRSDSSTRVNDAYFSVVTLATGDVGNASVEIVMPSWFEVDWVGGPFVESSVGLARILRADGLDPAEFGAFVTGRSDRSLVESALAPEGEFTQSVSVAPWPDDDEWRAFVSEGVIDVLPTLRQLIGVDWPVAGELMVRETNSGDLHGYAGVFYKEFDAKDDAVIEVGETLDLSVLAHELAHGWFNGGFTSEAWIYEGLAEEFARLALLELREEFEPFDPVRRSDPDAIELRRWTPDVSEDADGDLYVYSAASSLFERITDEVGAEGLRTAIVLLTDQTSPYGGGDRLSVDGRIDWRRLLDALEIGAGSTVAEQEFVEWVLSSSTDSTLEKRRAAIEVFDALQARADGWGVPDRVREDMTRWRFARATTTMAEINQLFDSRDDVATRAAELGLEPPHHPQLLYSADHDGAITQSATAIDEQADALAAVTRAMVRQAIDPGFVATIGLRGQDPDADLEAVHDAFEEGDFERVAALADELVALRDGAAAVGRFRLAVAGGSALALLGLVLWRLMSRRRGGEGYFAR